MPITLQVAGLKYKDGNVYKSVDCLKGDSFDIGIIAPDYTNMTFPIAVGKMCSHNGKLYSANQSIQNSEVWTAEHWNEITIEDELSNLKNDLSDKAEAHSPSFTGAMSLGRKNNATSGTNSIALGNNATASGNYSVSLGIGNNATGGYSKAAGYETTASGDASSTEGWMSEASGDMSHAQGFGTIANHLAQSVSGIYNVADPSNAQHTVAGNYVEIVGNGTGAQSRSNAYALDWNGNAYFKGDVYVGCNADSTGGTKLVNGGGGSVDFATDAEVQEIIDDWGDSA